MSNINIIDENGNIIETIDTSGPTATCIIHRITHFISQGCVVCNLGGPDMDYHFAGSCTNCGAGLTSPISSRCKVCKRLAMLNEPTFIGELVDPYDTNEFATAADAFVTCDKHGTKFPEGFYCVPCEAEQEDNNYGHSKHCPIVPACVCGADDDDYEDEETTRLIEDHEWWGKGL